MSKKNRIISVILNLAIAAVIIVGLIIGAGDLNVKVFEFYTEDSNIFAMFACLIMAICQILCLSGKIKSIPQWVNVIKYISICVLSVTFLVVVFALAPMMGGLKGYKIMLFEDLYLYHHLLSPVMAFVTYIFVEKETAIEKKHIAYAMIPTILYAIVVIILNIARIIEGPYPFLRVYEQPVFMSCIWFVLILGGACGIATLVRLIKNKALNSKISKA